MTRRLTLAALIVAWFGFTAPAAVTTAAPGPADLGSPATTPATRQGAAHAVPLYGEMVRPFDAPEDNPFAPGHRGVDVAAPIGSPVRSSAPGTVAFAGVVAGNRSVSVDHGAGLTTTYSFLGTIEVSAGAWVERGDVVGTVGAGHPGPALPPHVHLSARRDGVYLDPLRLYVGSGVSDLLSLVA